MLCGEKKGDETSSRQLKSGHRALTLAPKNALRHADDENTEEEESNNVVFISIGPDEWNVDERSSALFRNPWLLNYAIAEPTPRLDILTTGRRFTMMQNQERGLEFFFCVLDSGLEERASP